MSTTERPSRVPWLVVVQKYVSVIHATVTSAVLVAGDFLPFLVGFLRRPSPWYSTGPSWYPARHRCVITPKMLQKEAAEVLAE
jgi:hypothetical protein